EGEQHLHQGSGVDVDPLREVGQRRPAGQPDGLAVALADAHPADRRGLHGLELLTTRPLGLAAPSRRATGTTEGTLGLAASTATGRTGTTATGETATGRGATAPAAAGSTGATGRTGTTRGAAAATGTTGARTTAGAATEG